MRVLVAVGTHEQGFDRLVNAVESVIADRGNRDEVFVQYGAGSRPRTLEGADFLSAEELHAKMGLSDCLISQASPGLANEALRAGCVPLLMPRRAALGEAVDDHQYEFASYLADHGAAFLVTGAPGIVDALMELEANTDAYTAQMRRYAAHADSCRRAHALAIQTLLSPEHLLRHAAANPLRRRIARDWSSQ